MKIERDGDVIHFHDEEEGVVGSTVQMVVEQTFDEEQIARYWDYCAERITPSGHTPQEALRWLEENWDLEPLPPDDRQMKTQRANIAGNLFPDKYGSDSIDFDMTDEEIESEMTASWVREEEAQKTTDEQLGIRLHGYHIPYTPRNQVLYEKGLEAWRKTMEEHNQQIKQSPPGSAQLSKLDMEKEMKRADAYLFLEETQCSFSASGTAASELFHKLSRYLGITEEDIKTRSMRFMSYVYDLAQAGELPTLQEFCAQKEV